MTPAELRRARIELELSDIETDLTIALEDHERHRQVEYLDWLIDFKPEDE